MVAGVAIENARLHRRVADVAVYEERDRLARDLHDTVIQRLFAVGLTLQGLAGRPDAAAVRDRLHRIIADVDDTIRQVRTSIFELELGRSWPKVCGPAFWLCSGISVRRSDLTCMPPSAARWTAVVAGAR